MEHRRAAVLQFVTDPETRAPSIGRVHSDGSITFRGVLYPNIIAVPPECRAFRADLSSQTEWLRLYREIDPSRKRTRA